MAVINVKLNENEASIVLKLIESELDWSRNCDFDKDEYLKNITKQIQIAIEISKQPPKVEIPVQEVNTSIKQFKKRVLTSTVEPTKKPLLKKKKKLSSTISTSVNPLKKKRII